MNFIVTGRQTGKTTRCLYWLSGHPNRIMVCLGPQEVKRLQTLVLDERWDINAEQFITVDRVGYLRGRRNVEVCVDNLDVILPYLLHAPVEMVTATGGLYTG